MLKKMPWKKTGALALPKILAIEEFQGYEIYIMTLLQIKLRGVPRIQNSYANPNTVT